MPAHSSDVPAAADVAQLGSAVRLADFFDMVYCPLQLRGRQPGPVANFRYTIGWLKKSLGREPTLADLNRGSMLWLMRYLVDAGLGQIRIKFVRKKLCALWRYAATVGLGVAYDPPPLPAAQPIKRTWLEHTARPGTLLKFYRNVYRPQLVALAAQQTISGYDAAINRFHDHGGCQVRIDDVQLELLQAFEVWLAEQQMPTKEIGNHVEAIRRVLRAAKPDRWEQRNAGQRKFMACEPVPSPPASAARKGVGPRPPLPQIGGEPGTLAHFFSTVYGPEELITSLPGQAQHYARLLRFMRKCFGRDLEVLELTEARVAEYTAWLIARGRKPETALNHRRLIVALWRCAVRKKLLPNLPLLPRIHIDREEPDAWSYDEAQRILQAAGRLRRPPIAGILAHKFWHALLLVGWWTALRRGSLLAIRVSDVNLSTGRLTVPAAQMKNGRGKRFQLGADAIAAIRAIVGKGNRELLFPLEPENGRCHRDFKAILQLAGIEPTGHRNNSQMHKWRRTVATCVASTQGLAAAMTLLGHSGPEVTLRYIDPSKMPGNDVTSFLPSLTPGSQSPFQSLEVPNAQ